MSEQNDIEQGAVLVDIGDGYGALVVIMPTALVGVEVELVPTGTAHQHGSGGHGHQHDDGHIHDRGHTHDHPHDHEAPPHVHHGHGHEHGLDLEHPPHVAVVNRRLPNGQVVPTLVFGTLLAGTYDLYVRPHEPVALTVQILDGQVTQATWPGADAP